MHVEALRFIMSTRFFIRATRGMFGIVKLLFIQFFGTHSINYICLI